MYKMMNEVCLQKERNISYETNIVNAPTDSSYKKSYD